MLVFFLSVKAKHVEIARRMVMVGARITADALRFPLFSFLLITAAFVLGMMSQRQRGQFLRQRRRRGSMLLPRRRQRRTGITVSGGTGEVFGGMTDVIADGLISLLSGSVTRCGVMRSGRRGVGGNGVVIGRRGQGASRVAVDRPVEESGGRNAVEGVAVGRRRRRRRTSGIAV